MGNAEYMGTVYNIQAITVYHIHYVTDHPGGCWFHKFFYKSGSFADIFILKEFDNTIKTNFTCVDGCVYTRVGDPFTTEYCFEESPDTADEALNEYILPQPSCNI